jgi:hypothetical protein
MPKKPHRPGGLGWLGKKPPRARATLSTPRAPEPMPEAKLVSLPPPARRSGRAVLSADLLDGEARGLVRLAAVRLLRATAGVDDSGVDIGLDPKSSKDAIAALAMLIDKIPDVLSIEGDLQGDDRDQVAIDIQTVEGEAALLEDLRALPPSLLAKAMGEG